LFPQEFGNSKKLVASDGSSKMKLESRPIFFYIRINRGKVNVKYFSHFDNRTIFIIFAAGDMF